MISRIERAEASPTATLLGRLSGAFDLTLSTLLARAEEDGGGIGRLVRVGMQPQWRDPATGYVRRAVSPPGAMPELVHVALPPGVTVSFPASAYTHIGGQCVWVLAGELVFQEGSVEHRLSSGDCLALGPPAACVFANASTETDCTYLVALVHHR